MTLDHDPTGTADVRAALRSAASGIEPSPSLAADVRRGGRARQRRRRLTVVGTAALAAVTAIAVLGVTMGYPLIGRYAPAGPVQEDLLPGGGAGSIDGAINLLVVGVDERADNPDLGARADSIIIVHIPATHDGAYLVSLSRFTDVEIPAYPKTGYAGGRDRINAAYYHGSQNGGGRKGGFDLLAQTIRTLVPGIRFNGAAVINFDGFTALVDTLGGVGMCVDEQVTSVHIGFDASGGYARPFLMSPDGLIQYPIPGVTPKVYPVGCYRMQSWEALDYVRQRDLLADGDGEYGSQRHQQQLLKALLRQAISTGFTDPVKLAGLLRGAGEALTFDGGTAKLADWIFTLRGVNPDAVVLVKTNAGHFTTAPLPDGASAELLSATSLELLQSVRDDKVAGFVAAHPDWVSP